MGAFLNYQEIQLIELIFGEIFKIGKYEKNYNLNFFQKKIIDSQISIF